MVSAALLVLVPGALAAQERREVPEFRTFGAPATPQDAEAIDELMVAFKEAWAAQDVERWIALHADDVEWINAYARMFRGTEALEEFIAGQLFPAFSPAVSREEAANMTLIFVRYVGDDAAVVHWYTDGSRGASRTGGGERRRTHLHFVLEKADAEWRIAHEVIFDAR